jgi:uncharacterized protein
MNTDKGLTLEIFAVVIFTVGRAVATDVGLMVWLESRPIRPFGYNQFTEILRGLYLAGFVIFIVWLRQLSFREIGISPPNWGKDFVIGILLVMFTAVLWTPFALLLNKFEPVYFHQIPQSVQSPSTLSQYLWLVVATATAGFAEELLTRGYLISRLRRLTAPWNSVVLSAVVFSVWHVSQGVFGVAHTFIWGLVYGYTFTKVGRIWPLVFGHITNNLIFELLAS